MSHECWDIYGGYCGCGKSVIPKPVELDEITVDERVGRALMDANAALDRVRALRDSLIWKRPAVCPCDSPEECCGSEESCEAMNPMILVCTYAQLNRAIEGDDTA